jgi:UDP-GlcNAc:undecaprenyl-phosphate GlcNAc-1-phosphate transferase
MVTMAGGPGHGIVLVFLATFLFSCLSAVMGTYLVRRFAASFGLVDVPDGDRRLHQAPVPRVGGIAVYIAVAGVLLVALLTLPNAAALLDHQRLFFSLILGSTAIFGLGLLDDAIGLSPRIKLACEVIVAMAMFSSGVRIESIGLLGNLPLAPWLSLVVTTLWIVGVTNAFNLIDGSDGVAGGAALFASSSIATISLVSGHTLGAVAALAIAGATLGFLFFNFPPASVFLGDSGSLFLGFTLGVLGIVTTQTATTTLAVAIPVVAFGLPILDMLLTITRRFLRGDGIFNADRGHIHHRLHDLGHTPRKVALLLYAVSAGFALLSMLLVHPHGAVTATIFVVAGATVVLGVQRLNIPELLEVRRILRRGLQQRVVIAHNVRLREAAVRLQKANSAHDIVRAMAHGLAGGEFTRAELAMPAEMAHAFVADGLAGRRGAHFVWQWEREVTSLSKTQWEVRLPVRLAAWHDPAHLSLWITGESEHLLTDLRLIALEIGPALEGSVGRLMNRRQSMVTAERTSLVAPREVSA